MSSKLDSKVFQTPMAPISQFMIMSNAEDKKVSSSAGKHFTKQYKKKPLFLLYYSRNYKNYIFLEEKHHLNEISNVGRKSGETS